MKICLSFLLLIPTLISAQSFTGESVEHDPILNRFFTSSNSTSIIQRAANGEISYFGTDLEADYGMEVMGNTLFALTGDQLKGYDLTSELEVMSVTIPGAGFLNGLTNDGVSRLWATDFTAKKIYEIDVTNLISPLVSTVVNETEQTPNGIIHDESNNRLIYVTWSGGNIKAVDLSDYSVLNVTNASLNNMDGIDEDNEGNYYVSSWSPLRISKFSNDFSTNEIVSVPGLNSPADICYAKTIDTLAIPSTSQPVIFVDFNTTGVKETSSLVSSVNIYPNPVSDIASLIISLEKEVKLELNLYGLKGQFIRSIISDGIYPVKFNCSDLENGVYFIQITGEGFISNYPLLVER